MQFNLVNFEIGNSCAHWPTEDILSAALSNKKVTVNGNTQTRH